MDNRVLLKLYKKVNCRPVFDLNFPQSLDSHVKIKIGRSHSLKAYRKLCCLDGIGCHLLFECLGNLHAYALLVIVKNLYRFARTKYH